MNKSPRLFKSSPIWSHWFSRRSHRDRCNDGWKCLYETSFITSESIEKAPSFVRVVKATIYWNRELNYLSFGGKHRGRNWIWLEEVLWKVKRRGSSDRPSATDRKNFSDVNLTYQLHQTSIDLRQYNFKRARHIITVTIAIFVFIVIANEKLETASEQFFA